MLGYYDPEYDRVVDETTIENQYRVINKYTRKSYEEFKADNFPRDFRAMSYLYFEKKRIYDVSSIQSKLESWLDVSVEIEVVCDTDIDYEITVKAEDQEFNLYFNRESDGGEAYYQISPMCRHC